MKPCDPSILNIGTYSGRKFRKYNGETKGFNLWYDQFILW